MPPPFQRSEVAERVVPAVPGVPALGARSAPLFKVTAPWMVPLPPRVPPELTVTAPVPVPLPEVFATRRAPALTMVPPVKVLAPVRVTVLTPVLVKLPEPLTVLEMVYLLVEPVAMTWPLSVMLLVSVSVLARSVVRVPAEAMVTLPEPRVAPVVTPLPSWRVPAVRVVPLP